jgi:antirestriction protein ArdC
MLKMSRDLFQEITDLITAQLDNGVMPWVKPWREGAAAVGSATMPHNVKGRPYRGANAFWLDLIGTSKGYAQPVWLTFNQAREMGGSVRKGEKGTAVFFWKFDKKPDPANPGKLKDSVMVRQYIVFNLDQCEGLTVAEPKARTLQERVEAAEALAEATGAVISYGGARAFYSPHFDSVQMPDRGSFKSADGLYGTLFHELGHWTGHDSRLKRDFKGRFGSEAYAFEELVAELTAAFICGSQGFTALARPDHASYIDSWLKVLKGDKRAFITAASQAQKAADFILASQAAADESEPDEVAEAA